MIEEAQRVKELGFSTSSLRGTLPGFEKPYSYTSLCFLFSYIDYSRSPGCNFANYYIRGY